eukprot:s1487_g11.t1
MKSGSAHWDLELADEVRQCPLRSATGDNEARGDDKIQAVFKVFDENDDGFISMDEMYKFLTSVFKVVLTPAVLGAMNSMGVNVESAEDYSICQKNRLVILGVLRWNHDGRLSIEEFKSWFYGPRNDPAFMFSPVRKLLQ